MDNILVLLVASVLAKASHSYYSKNEPTTAGFLQKTGYLSATASVSIVSIGDSLKGSLGSILVFVLGYLSTLLLFIALYRSSSRHPLARFPGPRLAKYSQLVYFWWTAKGQTRLVLQEWHKRYGDVVRIGPNSLSFADPAAIVDIHGTDGFTKGPAYDASWTPGVTHMLGMRDHAEHARRRRIWDRAFNQKSLKGYQEHLRRLTGELVDSLASNANTKTPLDLHLWFGYLTYDMMSEIAFSGGPRLLRNDANALKTVEIVGKAVTVITSLRPIPWAIRFLGFLPKSEDVVQYKKDSRDLFKSRLKEGTSSARTDVFSWLLGEENEDGNGLSEAQLEAESNLVIAAGADTTRTTFTSFFYYILSDTGAYDRLQAAVDALSPEEAEDFTVLANLAVLDAYIQETLRMSPSVASGAQRRTPEGGATIARIRVPGDTQVIVPQYVLHRDPRFFDRPDEFRPERWLKPEGETRFERKAFFPFLIGPYGCVGKQMALQELRYVIVALLRSFRFRFAEEEFERGLSPAGFTERYEDRFVIEIREPLKVVLSARNIGLGASA